MIGGVWAWLTDPDHWAGSTGILARLGEHVGYSLAVLLLAALVAIPVGLWVGHTGRGRWLVTSANAARAVPSLGLLFAAALWLGPRLRGDLAFVLPSIIALVVLAVPPMLSATYAGVEAVDPAARDAARGMGMRPFQLLTRVELPCATPLIASGVRSATLQVVATATIASFVSLGGLGVFLVDGLASGDYPRMAGGAILVALLALFADGVLDIVERVVVPRGLRLRPDRGGARTSGPADEPGALDPDPAPSGPHLPQRTST